MRHGGKTHRTVDGAVIPAAVLAGGVSNLLGELGHDHLALALSSLALLLGLVGVAVYLRAVWGPD